MSPHAATFREALRMFEFMAGWEFPWLTVEVRENGRIEHFDHRCGLGVTQGLAAGWSGDRLVWLVEHLEQTRNASISLTAPERGRGMGQAGATFLTVRVEGTEQVKRAARLRPLPSLVLREGGSSRRSLLWWLQEPADYFAVEEANRKLAYAVGATQRHGVPEHIRIPAPGSCVRDGARPKPVAVTRLDPGAFVLEQVVGRLKEPPPRDAWLQNKGAA